MKNMEILGSRVHFNRNSKGIFVGIIPRGRALERRKRIGVSCLFVEVCYVVGLQREVTPQHSKRSRAVTDDRINHGSGFSWLGLFCRFNILDDVTHF
jgi:hypothetical protein